MKKLICFVLLFCLLVLSACSSTPAAVESTPVTAKYIGQQGSYFVYRNAKKWFEDADIIFLGKVTDISFALHDYTTGMPITKETKNEYKDFYTLYDIDVIKQYRGKTLENPTQIHLNLGLMNVHIEEQLRVVQSDEGFAKTTGGAIPVGSPTPDIQLGKTYLFACYQSFALADNPPLNRKEFIFDSVMSYGHDYINHPQPYAYDIFNIKFIYD